MAPVVGTGPGFEQGGVGGVVDEGEVVAIGVGVGDAGFGLDRDVEHAADDAKGVEVELAESWPRGRELGVLLVKIAREGRAVVAAVAFGPEAYAVIGGRVVGESGEPDLEEVPEGICCCEGGIGGGLFALAGECADMGGQVALLGEIGFPRDDIEAEPVVARYLGSIRGDVVGKPDLVRLIDEDQVVIVVPAEWV